MLPGIRDDVAALISGGTLPDLVISALTAPSTGTIGGQISISASVTNSGTVGSGTYRLGFYFSTDQAITTGDTFSGTACGMSALGIGGTQNCSGPIAVPGSLTPGTYYLGAIADDQGQVAELSEVNNTRSVQITLSAPPDTTAPTISVFNVSPSTITLGQAFTINYTVSDSGGSGLKRVVLRRTSGDGSAFDPGWQDIKTNLASGNGPVSGSFSDIPPSAGTYWYGMAAVDNAGNSKDERQSGLGPVQRTVSTVSVLTVSVLGSGTVTSNPAGINNCSGTCSMSFTVGTPVSLTANPASGFSFGGWGGDCGGQGNPCSLTMTASKSVTATFTQQSFALTVTPPVNGTVTGSGITCPGTCTLTYGSGAPVTLTANPASGFSFGGWGGDCGGQGNPCSLTMTAAKSVTATFSPGGCTVTPISIGQTVSGALSTTDCRSPVRGSSYYADRYSFNASAGQAVAILLTSAAFDTYVFLIGPNGALVTENDDGGGGTNSRIPAGSGFYSLPSTGTYILEVTSFFANNTGTYTLSISTTSHDFNGDGKADILWRDTGSGSVALWLMNGANIASNLGVAVVPTNWTIAGVADFNGDGKADILWRDSSSGSVALWLMNGASIVSDLGVTTIPTSWTIVAVADFNGDGKADILWRHTSGAVALWLMNGANIVSDLGVTTIPTSWTIDKVADFNGDGKADILWRHTSGAVALWLMNGASIVSDLGVTTIPTSWTIDKVADFNGDGKADILWRHTSGAVALWLMNGASIVSDLGVTTIPTSWTIDKVADFNGDGKADILWRHTSGAVALWLMNGASIVSDLGVAVIPTNWTTQ